MQPTVENAVQYIRNTKNVPLRREAFDDDWEPVGPMLRKSLVEKGLVREDSDGGLWIVEDEAAPLTVQELIDHHAGEADATQGANEEANSLHNRAVTLLRLMLNEATLAGELLEMDAGISISLDVLEPGGRHVREAYLLFRLPALPLPGELLKVDDEGFKIIGRAFEVDLSKGSASTRLFAEASPETAVRLFAERVRMAASPEAKPAPTPSTLLGLNGRPVYR